MSKIRIVKKNDDYSMEYQVGDVFEIQGTWYGGVHIAGRTGIPVSLDKDEYEEVTETGAETVDLEPRLNADEDNTAKTTERNLREGDIVQHFKREWVNQQTSEYQYKILAFAQHTETEEKLVIYQALYAPFKIYARPYDMFMSEVDRVKYQDVKQKYRFEKVNAD